MAVLWFGRASVAVGRSAARPPGASAGEPHYRGHQQAAHEESVEEDPRCHREAALEQQVRVWGESVRRIADADAYFYHTQFEVPLLRTGMSESQMMQMATEAGVSMAPLLDQALVSMYHAQSEHTWMSLVVEAVEATLEKAGLHQRVARPPAMCFLDLSGYTRLTEERGDQAAAEMAASMGRLVQGSSHGHGGRPVKWLGDGVMVYFPQPGQAVASALEIVEGASSAGLPPAHGGIDAGPVIFQDGDYFGRTVNTAARIAAYAGPGQVLVSDNIVESSTDPRSASWMSGRSR